MSPDGELFRCHYEIYTPEWGTYLVTSKVLNFTAIEGGFTQTNSGRWSVNYFDGTKGGPEEPPDGYSFLNGTVLKGSHVIADFSEDTFINKKPI
jgi:hypothetical protein